MIEKKQYEERVIVFLDILGFKSHIERTTNDPAYFLKIRDALNLIKSYENYHEKYDKNFGKEITVFSDSVVISYPVQQKGAVHQIILDIIHLQLDMMANGIVMRGGLTVGQLCHKANIVYGPAMNRAYEIESKDAINPRVVVDASVLETAADNHIDDALYEVDEIRELLLADSDGKIFIDFMSRYEETDNDAAYLKALLSIKKLIIDELASNTDPSIVAKYMWLKEYFNSTVQKNSIPEGI